MPSTPPSGKFIATFFRPNYGTMVVKLVGNIISLGGLASSTINHHQPSSTIINHHQPSTLTFLWEKTQLPNNQQPINFGRWFTSSTCDVADRLMSWGWGFLNKKIRKPMKVGRNTPEKEELFPMTGIIEFTYFFVEMYIWWDFPWKIVHCLGNELVMTTVWGRVFAACYPIS